jgi:hypothetical protein
MQLKHHDKAITCPLVADQRLISCYMAANMPVTTAETVQTTHLTSCCCCHAGRHDYAKLMLKKRDFQDC